MARISVLINTINEEKNLPKALSSVKNFADEIIVVDMKSDDSTQRVAKEFGAKVFEHERTNYVEAARNFAISKASNKWVFLLDADERATDKLLKKLGKIARDNEADFVRIPRKNIVFGKWLKHSRWWPDLNIRFFKKGKVSWNEVIHRVPMTVGEGLDLPSKEKYAIIHDHYRNIEQYLERMNRYTTEHGKLLKKEGYQFKWQDLVKKPVNEFLSRYFFGKGYKDGIHGLAVSTLQAFSELILFLKIWQMEKFREEDIKIDDVNKVFQAAEKEINYWKADTLVNERGGLLQRIKRKFMLP